MTKPFQVMLATDYEPTKLTLPAYASPKLDGVRAYVKGGVVLSRKNKPIPNKHVQKLFGHLEDMDGELIVGAPTDPMCFRNTMSGVMSVDGEPDVTFWLFDTLTKLDAPYHLRNPAAAARKYMPNSGPLPQMLVTTLEQLGEFEAECLRQGYEGVILRKTDAPYKQGRSTVREGFLLKVKSFLDSEATVVGFEERMKNLNEATVDETGRTKRSSHKENKVGRGDLGALIVEWQGMRFNIGTGFTDDERLSIWQAQSRYMGQLVKFRYFPVGAYEAPRHPVFVGFRDRRDV